MTQIGDQSLRIHSLGLTVYNRMKSSNKWLLPVCADKFSKKLELLNPNNLGNWEDVDIDGCPTICYRFTGKQIKAWNKLGLHSVWGQFADRLGSGPAKEFFNELWVKVNNDKANARNEWERKHGGIKKDRFDRGMTVRNAARMSIT